MTRTFAASTQFPTDTLRVATYNIHKGVRGVGPRKRLEIHNLGLGIEALDADLVFLQEVRSFHHGEARRFERTWFGWPKQGQADFLAPEGYDVAYRTNAYTRDGDTCHDFLASYVGQGAEAWYRGEACRAQKGKWEVKSLRPWARS